MPIVPSQSFQRGDVKGSLLPHRRSMANLGIRRASARSGNAYIPEGCCRDLGRTSVCDGVGSVCHKESSK